jgi:hypothetical protein
MALSPEQTTIALPPPVSRLIDMNLSAQRMDGRSYAVASHSDACRDAP